MNNISQRFFFKDIHFIFFQNGGQSGPCTLPMCPLPTPATLHPSFTLPAVRIYIRRVSLFTIMLSGSVLLHL